MREITDYYYVLMDGTVFHFIEKLDRDGLMEVEKRKAASSGKEFDEDAFDKHYHFGKYSRSLDLEEEK